MINFKIIGSLDKFQRNFNKNFRRLINLISFLKITSEMKKFNKQYLREKKWNKVNDSDSLKYDFNFLNSQSRVIDTGGGSIGEFSRNLFSKYNCNIDIYEPVTNFYLNLKKFFLYNKKIKVFNFGILDKNEEKKLYLAEGGSSIYQVSESTYQSCKFLDVKELIGKKIDLLASNCEGSEYQILNRIIELKLQSNIYCYFIQFHDIDYKSKNLKNSILFELMKTHELIFDYEFVYTKLVLKKNEKNFYSHSCT
jgi:hypothetical protein